MADPSISPGMTLSKPLVHPTTGNILLPAGTVLTQTYIDRLSRQGLEQHLAECLGVPSRDDADRAAVKDIDAFDIEIPDLPDILSQFMPAAEPQSAPASPPAWAQPGFEPAAAAAPPASPHVQGVAAFPGAYNGMPPAGANSAAPAPGWVPDGAPPSAPPGFGQPIYGQVPSAPPARPVEPPAMPPQRYYHNPAHLIPERAVYGAMQAVDSVEATLKIGQMPPQDLVRRVVDEVVDRLMQKQADLNNGLELRIVNQPHHRCHPVNVMVLSAVMGLAMGYDREQLRTLALGALFHDVGKTAIAPEVLHKQGPLTAQEIELLRAHPLIGKRIIDKMPWANATMGTIVYQHHERVDGSGYPLRLQGAQIHEMSRIVAVAEVYDSLVSDTAWRPRYAPELAYNAIKGGEKEGHDPNVIRAFLRYVFPYPLHAWVVMENNEIAQVVQVSRSNPTRPMVKIGNATYDLAAHPHRKILNVTYQAFY